MKNLIEQASLWLRSEACLSGSILKRTEAVIRAFRSYVQDSITEISKATGLTNNALIDKIDVTEKQIRIVLSSFLRGNQLDALRYTHHMMKEMKFDKLEPGRPLYKCRENSRLYHLSSDELFHIPYDKRNLVRNQRFSLSGQPCLYLGGSSYICWEEIGRKDFSTCNYCGFSLKVGVQLFDMLLPANISDAHQISRVVLALACSLSANRKDFFKPEYILPQCVLHSLIYRSYYNHSPLCVRYYSSHLLNGDADYFSAEFDNPLFLPRYVNYVFPAASSKNEGYNDELRKVFNQTETVSLLHETLIDPVRMTNAVGKDTYLLSQFGLMDAILDEKLGFEPKRQEGVHILAAKEPVGIVD